MKISYITHDEAMIQNFVEDPDYAAFYLKEVMSDGDINEIRAAQAWVDEARARRAQFEEVAGA